MTRSRSWCAAVMVALGALVSSAGTGRGEALPGTGTFDGVYHRDLWGNATFGHFVVDAALHPQLAPYADRWIRLEVTKGGQRTNPGPAYAHAIGAIREMPQSPASVELRTVPRSPRPDQPFQVLAVITNTTDTTLTFEIGLTVRVLSDRAQGEDPTSTADAMHFYGFAQDGGGSHPELRSGRDVTIAPKDRFTCMGVFEQGLPRGVHELSGLLRLRKTQGASPVYRCRTLTIGDTTPGEVSPPSAPRVSDLTVDQVRTGEAADHYELRFVLKAPGKEGFRVPQCPRGSPCAGRVRAFGADGKRVDVTGWDFGPGAGPPQIWSLTPLPGSGLQVHIRASRRSGFDATSVRRWILDLATEEGLVSVVLTDDFEDALAVDLPAFGREQHGLRMRGHVATAPSTDGLRVCVRMQAVNDTGLPFGWRIDAGDGFALDGVPLPSRSGGGFFGWARADRCNQPYEWCVHLPRDLKLTSGRHSLRFQLHSNGGTFGTSDRREIPVIAGDISSDEMTFDVP